MTAPTAGQALNGILFNRAWTIGRWETLAEGDRAEMESMAAEFMAAMAAAAPLVLTVTDLGALVNAGQDYDHEYRPKGRTWTRVTDHQAARLILGAVAKLRETEQGEQPQAAPELAAAMTTGQMTPGRIVFEAWRGNDAASALVPGWDGMGDGDRARWERAARTVAGAMADYGIKLRNQLADVLGWFTNNGSSGRSARVSGTVLAREYKRAGIPLPDDLKKLAGQ